MNTRELLMLNADIGKMGGWLAGYTITDADDAGAVEIKSPGLQQPEYEQVGAILRRKGWQGVIVYAERVVVRSWHQAGGSR